jgi:signal recognition particle subunit SRP19
MCRENPKLSYTINPPTLANSRSKSKTTSDPKPAPASKSSSKKNKASSSSSTTKPPPKKLRTRTPLPPQPVLGVEERLPLHSPLAHTGIAVSSIKRDLDNEKEEKKKAISGGGGGAGEDGTVTGTPGKDKQPKMKRMVVRGKR